jgi:serine/threonine protein phosphatase PrpC
MVDDVQIMRCMGPRDSLEAIADRLIGCAKAAGGKDNITVVLAQVN